MGARSVSTFNINIGMVNLPVKAYVAVDEPSSGISMRLLHAECKTPIQQKRTCPKCNKALESADIVKGFEYEKDRFVTFSQDELDAIRPDSSDTVPVTFVPESAIDPIHFMHAYYLTPQEDAGAASFAYMREAMKGRIAIGTWTHSGRDHLVGIRPHGQLLVMHVLHQPAEVRDAAQIGIGGLKNVTIDERQLKLARSVVEAFSDDAVDLSTAEDSYRKAFLQLKDAKLAGEEAPKVEPKAAPKVADFMAALEASLAVGKPVKKQMAKADAPAKKQRKAS